MQRKSRIWQKDQEDDPVSGLVNLFDVWIVVVVALMLALVRYTVSSSNTSFDGDETKEAMASEIVEKEASKLPRFRKSASTLSGQGELLGTAYRLQNGEIVYVPQTSNSNK